jgi:hypothetical protein
VVRFNGTANRCREEVERIMLGSREHPEEYEQMGLLLRFPSRKPGEKHQRDTTTPLRPARPAHQTGRRIARQSPQDKIEEAGSSSPVFRNQTKAVPKYQT